MNEYGSCVHLRDEEACDAKDMVEKIDEIYAEGVE